MKGLQLINTSFIDQYALADDVLKTAIAGGLMGTPHQTVGSVRVWQ
jgi:hypothetical protein